MRRFALADGFLLLREERMLVHPGSKTMRKYNEPAMMIIEALAERERNVGDILADLSRRSCRDLTESDVMCFIESLLENGVAVECRRDI
ncbi:hypothetical protein JW921_09235 [Candidatus Fermentibacterales bacterium]|nr:hypothetical protein [Candidatus Fermentibacterales bacterium]